MAWLDKEIDTSQLPEGNSYDPVPAGWYQVRCTESELCDTRTGTGQYVKCRLDILGPTHQGRCIFTNFNIRNPNAKAEEIGMRQLAEMARAGGIAKVTDTDQLIGATLQVKVVTKADEKYGEGNEVKGFRPYGGAQAAAIPTVSAPQQQAMPGTEKKAAKPPWAR